MVKFVSDMKIFIFFGSGTPRRRPLQDKEVTKNRCADFCAPLTLFKHNLSYRQLMV